MTNRFQKDSNNKKKSHNHRCVNMLEWTFCVFNSEKIGRILKDIRLSVIRMNNATILKVCKTRCIN